MECVESALLIGCIRKKSEIGPWAVMQGPGKQSLKAQGVGVVEVLPLSLEVSLVWLTDGRGSTSGPQEFPDFLSWQRFCFGDTHIPPEHVDCGTTFFTTYYTSSCQGTHTLEQFEVWCLGQRPQTETQKSYTGISPAVELVNMFEHVMSCLKTHYCMFQVSWCVTSIITTD